MTILEERVIFITEADREKLGRIVNSERESLRTDQRNLEALEKELDRAEVVGASEVPRDVVTLGSRVRIRDLVSGEIAIYTLVFPEEADISRNRISVLAPIGTAILGYSAGDVIEWKVPGGTRKLRIEEVLYQPEAAGRERGAGLPWNFPLDTGCKV
ncbi:MAG TPA: nucleoside diphosphate kinase regulator [Terriglobia bacterium]|nr:nucleoside diphosphate kinase regulator [Terriglobia bacterium]